MGFGIALYPDYRRQSRIRCSPLAITSFSTELLGVQASLKSRFNVQALTIEAQSLIMLVLCLREALLCFVLKI